MSLVDDLSAIQKLYENGALSDEEFKAAKAEIIGQSQSGNPSPIIEASTHTAPLPPPSQKSRSKFLDPKENLKGLLRMGIILAVLVGGGWFFIRLWLGGQIANRVVQTLVRAPIDLRDSVESIQAHSWKAFGLSLPYPGNLTLAIEVTRGNPFT
jgi:hypothetical protein